MLRRGGRKKLAQTQLRLLVVTDKRVWRREVTLGALLFLALLALALLWLLGWVLG